MPSLESRVVVITGASAGIGAACARELARRGCKLVLAARRVEKLEAVAGECRGLGAEVRVVPGDVAKRGDIDRLVAATIEEFGRLDVMYANAGYGFLAKIADVSETQFDEIVATNVKGSWYAMQAAFEVMRKQSPLAGAPARAARGHIILTSSGAARRGMPLYGVYSMTKAAQLSLAEAMRVEVAGTGVYVSTVHPLSTATEFFEVASSRSRIRSLGLGRSQSAEVVARKIARLIGRPRPELWPVFGSSLGLAFATAFPRMGDFFMRRTIGARVRGK